jgi:hypothetical protein
VSPSNFFFAVLSLLTYAQIPRILSPVTTPSIQQKTTSSFKNSGREKTLLTNGKYFETLREEETMCNIGPGMYDVSPYPSYMGQQLINPTIIDYRYRQHCTSRHRGGGNDKEERKVRTKRLSMNDILSGNKTSLPATAPSSAQSSHRPHTTAGYGTSSMMATGGGTATGMTGGGTINGRVGIKEKQLLTERKTEIENVQNLPEFPQRFSSTSSHRK